jgi:predicted TPR repeat methyltransferase
VRKGRAVYEAVRLSADRHYHATEGLAFCLCTARRILRRPVTQSRYAEIFTDRTDPFGYEVKPFESEKFEAAIELLDIARDGACFERAWEIGCAEGVLTARLARICERLSAVDFIPLVLERARVRCQEFSNISFSKWDLKSSSTRPIRPDRDHGRARFHGAERYSSRS